MKTFYEVTLEPEPFARLIDTLISICGRSVQWNKDLKGVDTAMLKDSLQAWSFKFGNETPALKRLETPLFDDVAEIEEPLEYEPEIFWDIYRRMADQFVKVFSELDLSAIPFTNRAGIRRFVERVWSSYFEEEVWALIDFDGQFPVLVIQAVSYPDRYLDIMNEIDSILMRRYRIAA